MVVKKKIHLSLRQIDHPNLPWEITGKNYGLGEQGVTVKETIACIKHVICSWIEHDLKRDCFPLSAAALCKVCGLHKTSCIHRAKDSHKFQAYDE